MSLYPTFEEWKPNKLYPSRPYIVVYILPLRNENRVAIRFNSSRPTSFISYLWGMKTNVFFIFHICNYVCLYPTFEEWKPGIWACDKACCIVYILPLRNENRYRDKDLYDKLQSLYPTFEEWKQLYILVVFA